MRISRSVSIVIAIASLALLAPTAALAATQTAPAAGAAVRTSKPKFSWSLVAGDAAQRIQVAASGTPDAAGNLPTPAIDSPLGATDTRFATPRKLQLFAGKWYWQVLAANAGVTTSSGVRAFTIPPKVLAPTLRIKSDRRGTSGTVRAHTNTATYKLRVQITHGRTRCYDKTVTVKRARPSLALWDAFKVYCYPQDQLMAGTKVATTVTVIANGKSKRATVRSVVT